MERIHLVAAAMDALSAHIAILDGDGTILAVNKAWRDFAEANPPILLHHVVGMNYLWRTSSMPSIR